MIQHSPRLNTSTAEGQKVLSHTVDVMTELLRLNLRAIKEWLKDILEAQDVHSKGGSFGNPPLEFLQTGIHEEGNVEPLGNDAIASIVSLLKNADSSLAAAAVAAISLDDSARSNAYAENKKLRGVLGKILEIQKLCGEQIDELSNELRYILHKRNYIPPNISGAKNADVLTTLRELSEDEKIAFLIFINRIPTEVRTRVQKLFAINPSSTSTWRAKHNEAVEKKMAESNFEHYRSDDDGPKRSAQTLLIGTDPGIFQKYVGTVDAPRIVSAVRNMSINASLPDLESNLITKRTMNAAKVFLRSRDVVSIWQFIADDAEGFISTLHQCWEECKKAAPDSAAWDEDEELQKQLKEGLATGQNELKLRIRNALQLLQSQSFDVEKLVAESDAAIMKKFVGTALEQGTKRSVTLKQKSFENGRKILEQAGFVDACRILKIITGEAKTHTLIELPQSTYDTANKYLNNLPCKNIARQIRDNFKQAERIFIECATALKRAGDEESNPDLYNEEKLAEKLKKALGEDDKESELYCRIWNACLLLRKRGYDVEGLVESIDEKIILANSHFLDNSQDRKPSDSVSLDSAQAKSSLKNCGLADFYALRKIIDPTNTIDTVCVECNVERKQYGTAQVYFATYSDIQNILFLITKNPEKALAALQKVQADSEQGSEKAQTESVVWERIKTAIKSGDLDTELFLRIKNAIGFAESRKVSDIETIFTGIDKEAIGKTQLPNKKTAPRAGVVDPRSTNAKELAEKEKIRRREEKKEEKRVLKILKNTDPLTLIDAFGILCDYSSASEACAILRCNEKDITKKKRQAEKGGTKFFPTSIFLPVKRLDNAATLIQKIIPEWTTDAPVIPLNYQRIATEANVEKKDSKSRKRKSQKPNTDSEKPLEPDVMNGTEKRKSALFIEDYEPSGEYDPEEFEHTDALPGTDEKLEQLANRIQGGKPLWHEKDRHGYSKDLD